MQSAEVSLLVRNSDFPASSRGVRLQGWEVPSLGVSVDGIEKYGLGSTGAGLNMIFNSYGPHGNQTFTEEPPIPAQSGISAFLRSFVVRRL